MAKKKATPKAPAADTRAIIATLKGSREFRDWLNEAAEADRVSTVQFLEKAAVFYAAHIGFGKPAPRRTEG